ncbi:hypothetical protein ACQ4PT_041732 [Festuca glaucescens]
MATEPAKGPSSGGDGGIEAMMKQLGISEDDLDDVVFEEEGPPPAEATRWLAIARVFTEGEYSIFWFFKNMRSAWDLAQDVKTRSLDGNLHTFQFACLGDWERVMQGGPWAFRGNPVLIEECDGFTKPSSIELYHFNIWIQIHDLPIGYAPMLKALASKVGMFISSEGVSNEFEGNFYWVRVKLDVRKPLKTVVSMVRAGKREPFLVKYERLPNWCQVCGHLGHEYKDHGDGLHPPQSLVFKDLRASWSMRPGGRPGRGRGSSRGAGRSGFGQGRGGRTGSSQYVPDEEDKDTVMSEEEVDLNMKRGAMNSLKEGMLEPPATSGVEGALVLVDNASKVGAMVSHFEPGAPPSPIPVRDPKRKKTEEEGKSCNNKINGALAGSPHFEPGAPPSPIPVRDPKRKKTEEEGKSCNNKINGALAGSRGEHRQAQ